MKIAVATTNGGLDDTVSPVFGRCPTYTFVNWENDTIVDACIEGNPGATATGGAGIQAAQFVAGKNVQAAIAGNFGPKAAAVLNAAHVAMVSAQGTVKDIVSEYQTGKLAPAKQPTVGEHYGMGRGGRRGAEMGAGQGRGGRRGRGP